MVVQCPRPLPTLAASMNGYRFVLPSGIVSASGCASTSACTPSSRVFPLMMATWRGSWPRSSRSLAAAGSPSRRMSMTEGSLYLHSFFLVLAALCSGSSTSSSMASSIVKPSPRRSCTAYTGAAAAMWIGSRFFSSRFNSSWGNNTMAMRTTQRGQSTDEAAWTVGKGATCCCCSEFGPLSEAVPLSFCCIALITCKSNRLFSQASTKSLVRSPGRFMLEMIFSPTRTKYRTQSLISGFSPS
mmetsp:Transcript_5276/g.11446  ORF Transcript_5276/g.11446 Transcript_5276/m.11446 type:complete len:242 (-) Transcript_5276:1450-2175(-)